MSWVPIRRSQELERDIPVAASRVRRSKTVRAVLAGSLVLLVSPSHGDVAQLSGKVTWGQRAICDRAQGRKLVFSGEAGKAEAAVSQGGHYNVKLEPGRYRVTLRCGGTDIKSLDVIGYPTPTQQDLAF
jgi:hypothetical protein